MASEARSTLGKARYFADQAARLGPRYLGFVANLEAAIAFGRSVRFHLRSEYARRRGFKQWEVAQEAALSPLAHFMEDTRNFVLHQGPAPVRRILSFGATLTAQFSVKASLSVLRGQPWYRRSIKILVEDITEPMRRRIHRWREGRRVKRERARAAPAPATMIAEGIYFADPVWQSQSALTLVRQYFNELEKIVADAEARF